MVPLFRCRTDNLLQALRYAAQFGSLRYRRCSRKGVDGIIELAPGYFPAVYSSIKKAGGLCIADEWLRFLNLKPLVVFFYCE
ncbi:hypothetical protein LOK49_Contig444G00002 [Camellia lanceoleosa]|nr:hypothetical protein LOK49_Contig444G00002 [Camellia lanceoleosa]